MNTLKILEALQYITANIPYGASVPLDIFVQNRIITAEELPATMTELQPYGVTIDDNNSMRYGVAAATPHSLESLVHLNQFELAGILSAYGLYLKEVGFKLGKDGAYDEAKQKQTHNLHLQMTTLQIRQTLYGAKNHPEIADSLKLVGFAYENTGDLTTARGYLAAALEMRRGIKRDIKKIADHSFVDALEEARKAVALSYCTIAFSDASLGKCDVNSLNFANKSLKKRQELFGSIHTESARGLEMRGVVFHKLGDRVAGLSDLYQALTIVARSVDPAVGSHIVRHGKANFWSFAPSTMFQKFSLEDAISTIKGIASEVYGLEYSTGLCPDLGPDGEIHPFAILAYLEDHNLTSILLPAIEVTGVVAGSHLSRLMAERTASLATTSSPFA